jgi:hypothetical protein
MISKNRPKWLVRVRDYVAEAWILRAQAECGMVPGPERKGQTPERSDQVSERPRA